LEGVFACAPDARQHLVRRAADGDDQAASDNELFLQRWWHHRVTRGNQDGIERGCLWPTLGAIAQYDLDVVVAERADALPRLIHQHFVKLYGDHALREPAHDRSRIAGPSSDLEHGILRPDLRQLEHLGDDIGLRYRLTGLDPQRRSLVCAYLVPMGLQALPR